MSPAVHSDPNLPTRSRSLERTLVLTAWVYICSILVNVAASSGYLLFHFRPAVRQAETLLVQQQRLENLRSAVRQSRMGDDGESDSPLAADIEELRVISQALAAAPVSAALQERLAEPVAVVKKTVASTNRSFTPTLENALLAIEQTLTMAIGNVSTQRDKSLLMATGAERWVFGVFLLNSAIGASLCVLGLYFVRRRVVQPVADLEQTATQIRQGDLDPRIQTRYLDEMGVLAWEIVRMAGHVKRLQQELVSRERQAAANEMVEHLEAFMREPLAEINRVAVASVSRNGGHPEVAACQERITATVDRFEQWLQAFRSQLSVAPGDLLSTDLDELMSDVVAAVRPTLERLGVALQVETANAPRQVCVDRMQFPQAVIALITNAAEASTSGQAVRVCCRRADDARTWELEVLDEGPGIPPDLLDRIFLPFFTTKPSGHGVGLSMVKAVVDRHDGQIAVDSVLGKGTRFTITLRDRA